MMMKLVEITIIGVPFCVFKIIAGITWNLWPLTFLGIIDLLINVTNFLWLLWKKENFTAACFLSFLSLQFKPKDRGSKESWEDFGNSMDMFLAFILVSVMIGGGQISKLDSTEVMFWNISVILNVLGAGLTRLSGAYQRLRTSSF